MIQLLIKNVSNNLLIINLIQNFRVRIKVKKPMSLTIYATLIKALL